MVRAGTSLYLKAVHERTMFVLIYFNTITFWYALIPSSRMEHSANIYGDNNRIVENAPIRQCRYDTGIFRSSQQVSRPHKADNQGKRRITNSAPPKGDCWSLI